MKLESNVREYSCVNCGLAFRAAPPDDFHPYSSVYKDELNDPIMRDYTCIRCKHKTTLYWGRLLGPK